MLTKNKIMKTNLFKQALIAVTFVCSIFIYSCDNDKSDDNETKNMNTGVDTSTSDMQQSVTPDSNSNKGAVGTDTVNAGQTQVTGKPDSSNK